jgi:hypothetical protein
MKSAFQEAEASKEGNGWIGAVLKGLKRSSPAGLKITLRSVMVFCNLIINGCYNKFLAYSECFKRNNRHNIIVDGNL